MKYQEFIDRYNVPTCFIGVSNTRYITEEEQLYMVEARFMKESKLFKLVMDLPKMASILDRMLFTQCPRHFSTSLSLDGLALEIVFDSSREFEFSANEAVDMVVEQLTALSKMKIIKGSETVEELREAANAADYLIKTAVVVKDDDLGLFPDTVMLTKIITEGLSSLKARIDNLPLEDRDTVVRDYLAITLSEDVSKLYNIEVICNGVTDDVILNVTSIDAEQPTIGESDGSEKTDEL